MADEQHTGQPNTTEGDKHATRRKGKTGKNTEDMERTQEGMEIKTLDKTRH